MSATATKIVDFIRKVRAAVPRYRKAVVAGVAALGFVVGVDAPIYQDILAVLAAAGVTGVANAPKE